MSTTNAAPKALKIAVIGPTHPYKGGIALHTTGLAQQLAAAGHSVKLFSWKAQYPKFLYPGEQRVAADKPEVDVFAAVDETLAWNNPLSWRKVGRALWAYDVVIFTYTTSVQVPSYLVILNALRGKAKTVAMCHNVLPHEPKPYDKMLATSFLNKVDALLVHTPEQAEVAKTITRRPVAISPLPPTLPNALKHAGPFAPHATLRHLLFFGLVRPYKGVDVLLEALAQVPDVSLTVAGEIWGEPGFYPGLAEKLGIQDRVTFTNGYVPAEDLESYFREADALVLPYRSGTASQNVLYAHAFKTPVIATTAGSLAEHIQDDVDGLLCEPDDVASLVSAITKLYKLGARERLARAVSDPRQLETKLWQQYTQALLGMTTQRRG